MLQKKDFQGTYHNRSGGKCAQYRTIAWLDTSESTVRPRDLITMDENGLLTKVRGGAIARRPSVSRHMMRMSETG